MCEKFQFSRLEGGQKKSPAPADGTDAGHANYPKGGNAPKHEPLKEPKHQIATRLP
jgi:hypothetical protein